MSKGAHITQEQKQIIYDLYDGGLQSRKEIASQIGCSVSAVSKILHKRANTTVKICAKCKRESGPVAKFCYFCGNDIRSKEELLLLRVQELRGMIVHLPENMRGDFDATTREIIGYLKEKGA